MISPKNRKHLDFEVWEKEVLKNPAFKAAYDRLQPGFAVINAIIEARREKGVTQQVLARKIGIVAPRAKSPRVLRPTAEVRRSENSGVAFIRPPKADGFSRRRTKQSVISRLESGRANPSVAFLKKLAQALNSHLEIKFTPLR